MGAAGWIVYKGVEKSRQETAGAMLVKAEDVASFQSIVNEHASTRAANSASILLAEAQWKEGQQDAAISTLRAFIDSNVKHPAMATAQASLAAKLMFQGKNTDAAALYQQVIDDPSSRHLAPYALISLGDVSRAGGDLEKAEAFYNRSRTDFPQSRFADTAATRIASLKAKAPTEVEPPPPAPAPPEAGATSGATSPVPAPSATLTAPVAAPQEQSAPPAADGATPSDTPSPAIPEQ